MTRRLERGLTLFTVVMVVGAAFVTARRHAGGTAPSESGLDTHPRPGSDTIAFFFLSSDCSACTEEPEATHFKRALKDFSQQKARLRLVGVAVEKDAARGAAYLSTVGDFDELSAGSGWNNELSIRYLFPDGLVHIANVPQLVLVERSIAFSPEPPETTSVRIRVLDRRLGLVPIVNWIRNRDTTGVGNTTLTSGNR